MPMSAYIIQVPCHSVDVFDPYVVSGGTPANFLLDNQDFHLTSGWEINLVDAMGNLLTDANGQALTIAVNPDDDLIE